MLLNENMEAIKIEVTSTYSIEELKLCPSFEAFFDLVDVVNAYEDEWNEKKEYWRPYYKQVWSELLILN